MRAKNLACPCLLVLAALAPCAAAQDAPRTGGAANPPRLLDVPFVSQTEALCGGAAAAMVLRYWGETTAYAEDFATLVDDSAEGITVNRLSRAIAERGWPATPFTGSTTDVEDHLARGRPIIALIEDRPGRYHYVVVVAWTGDRVVVHDPANGPFRIVSRTGIRSCVGGDWSHHDTGAAANGICAHAAAESVASRREREPLFNASGGSRSARAKRRPTECRSASRIDQRCVSRTRPARTCRHPVPSGAVGRRRATGRRCRGSRSIRHAGVATAGGRAVPAG